MLSLPLWSSPTPQIEMCVSKSRRRRRADTVFAQTAASLTPGPPSTFRVRSHLFFMLQRKLSSVWLKCTVYLYLLSRIFFVFLNSLIIFYAYIYLSKGRELHAFYLNVLFFLLQSCYSLLSTTPMRKVNTNSWCSLCWFPMTWLTWKEL